MNPEDEKLIAYGRLTAAQARAYVEVMIKEMPLDRKEGFIQTELERLTARARTLNQKYDSALPEDVRLRIIASLDVFDKRSERVKRTLSKSRPITIDDACSAIGNLGVAYAHLWTAGVCLRAEEVSLN